MPNGLVAPPDNDGGLSVGTASGGTAPKSNKKVWLYAGGGAVVLGLIYLYAKSKSAASSSSTTAAPEVVAPANNQDSTAGDIGSALSLQGTNDTNTLTQALAALEAEIAGNQSALLAAIPTAGAASTPSAAPATGSQTLVQQQQAELLQNFVGSGYNQGIAEIPGVGTFQNVATVPGGATGPNSESIEYYEPEPNVFVPYSGNTALWSTLAPNTPSYFLQQPSSPVGFQQG